MATINPYLIFNGNAEEAFNFYKSVFGGEFQAISRFGDSPEGNKVSENWRNKILHVSLPVGDSILMGSDPPENWTGNHVAGNNFNLSYSAKSEAEVDEKFKALVEGGQVYMAVSKTFWGSYFGMLRDKFGVQWMVSYDYK
jgi:PhnB protein